MKNLFFNGFAKLALIGAMLCGTFSAYAAYKISVYPKSGGAATEGEFSVASGSEYVCTLTIQNYTGNTTDYKYWIGNGGWEEGKSCNFELAYNNDGCARDCGDGSVGPGNYISSCSSGIITFYIYTDSGNKNYYPHNLTCVDQDCLPQAKGASIPAGTVIFYDNSDHLFDTEIWLSVPTESGNGDATNVNQGSYHRNKDSWYQMKKVDGDIWMATITTASSYGRMSFWNKDGHEADDVWQNTVVFQSPYTSGKNLYKADKSKDCYNSNRETHVYFKGSWSVYSSIVLVSDIYAYKYTEKPQSIKLTATPVGLTDTKYVFEYKEFDKDTWQQLASQTSNSYTLTGEGIPSKTTYYRVSYGGKTSPEVKIQVIISCADGGSSAHLFGKDFGTLPSLKGTDSRRGGEDMSSDYTYQPYPGKINDGYYAVVATPYYCGCGDGGDMSQSVEDCEGNNMWFRQYSAPTSDKKEFRDHTVGDAGTAGNYGGMLFINFKDGKSNIAYQHELTAEEKSLFKKGSTLSFSAYFANATKNEGGSLPIDMELVIQKKKAGDPETAWVDATKVSTKVGFNDNWQYQEASLDIEENGSAADYQLIIRNHGGTGVGNDVMIDDISVDLCVPTFPAEYYDNTKTPQTYTSTTFNKLTDNEVVRIADMDFGLGSNPCVYLLKVDDTKEIGKAGRYKYIKSMTLDGSYYTASVNAREILTSVPQSGNLQVFVTKESLCGQTTIDKLEAGTIAPMQSADYMFSQNLLDYSSTCSNVLAMAFDGNTTVCEESGKKTEDLPKINVTFGCISEFVKYTLKEDDAVLIDQKDITVQEISDGKLTIDLNKVAGVVRTPGSHEFTIIKTEYFTNGGSEICKSTAAAITLTVKSKPTYEESAWKAAVEKCDGFTQNISVSAQNATDYTWQVKKSSSSDWEDAEGTNNQATYIIPKTGPETGWKYRVILSNIYCTSVTSNETVLTVNVCDKVLLSINADKTELCKGEEVMFTVTVTNNGTVDVNNMEMTEDVSSMPGLQFVSATQSDGTFASNKWTVSLAPSAQATLELKYKSVSDVTVDNKERVYVSKLGSNTWTSYDEQEDTTMKGEWAVKSKGVSATPIISAPYNECATEGTKQLSELVSPSSDKTALEWFENPERTIVVDPATFDMNVPVKNKKYYVVNTEDGKCVSDKAEATVTVKNYATEADITAVGQIVCKGSEVTLSASTTTVVPNPIFRWYSDATLTTKLFEGNPYKVSPTEEVSYYISVENEDYCENKANDGKKVDISMKYPVTSISLKEKSVVEFDVSGVPTVKIGLGATTEKVLTIDPSDASNYSIKWYSGDNEFDGVFPRKPYSDQVYKVVLTDECGNVHTALAGTQVEWPTIFTPYNVDGANDDFVKGLESPISIQVYDRTGDMVYEGSDGWAGEGKNGTLVMPGVYFYVATLPDGSKRKATVEVYK